MVKKGKEFTVLEDLFEKQAAAAAPLADRMRPRNLDEFFGQSHIVGGGRLLRRAIETDSLTSSIFFGPPGSGKTTLAYVIACTTGAAFEKLNAVTSGVKDVRVVIDRAAERLRLHSQPTYLLLDECHRWSKTQSDSILPALEKGIIRFIGSTTENPMVSMTSAIVSRCRLFQFFALMQDDVKHIMQSALTDKERGYGLLNVELLPEALDHISNVANGDARTALNALELAVLTTPPNAEGRIVIDLPIAEESIQRRAVRCDDEGILQYAQRVLQIPARLGCGRGAVLVWPPCLRGCGSAHHRAAHHRTRQRGRRPCQPLRADAGRGRRAGAGV